MNKYSKSEKCQVKRLDKNGAGNLFAKSATPNFLFFYIKAPQNENSKICFLRQQKNSLKIS